VDWNRLEPAPVLGLQAAERVASCVTNGGSFLPA